MVNGSNDAVWRKEVPFGGLVGKKSNLGAWGLKNPQIFRVIMGTPL